jgi:hypothetical protein
MNIRLDESAVRALRDRVFDHRISDTSWHAVKEHWMKPAEIKFLQAHDFPLATAHSPEYLAEHQT